jgi:hypothetical protein
MTEKEWEAGTFRGRLRQLKSDADALGDDGLWVIAEIDQVEAAMRTQRNLLLFGNDSA